MFQSEPLYVPVKFHDLPSEKPENTSIDTEKSMQILEFHILEMGGNLSFIQAIPKARDFEITWQFFCSTWCWLGQ